MDVQVKFVEYFGRHGEAQADIQTYPSIDDAVAVIQTDDRLSELHDEIEMRAKDGTVYACIDGYVEELQGRRVLFIASSYAELEDLVDRASQDI